jgi:hypothetical protein
LAGRLSARAVYIGSCFGAAVKGIDVAHVHPQQSGRVLIDRGRMEVVMFHTAVGRRLAPELTLFMPIFMTAPLFGLICGLLLGQVWQ